MPRYGSMRERKISQQEEQDQQKTSSIITDLTKDNFSSFYNEIPKKGFPMFLNCPQKNHIGVFPIHKYSDYIDGNFMENENINLKDLLKEKISFKECSNYDPSGVLEGSFKIMYPIERGEDKKFAVMNVEVGKISNKGELHKHIKMLKEELEIQDAIYNKYETLVPKVYSANIFPMYEENPSRENCEPKVKMYLQIVMENIAVNGYDVVWKKETLRKNLIFKEKDETRKNNPNGDTKKTYWNRNKTFLINFFSTINKLHEAGYYHRDLNNMNIICNDNYDIKLIDFGFAKERKKNNKDTFRKVLERDIEEEFFEGKVDGMHGHKRFNFLGNDQDDKITKAMKLPEEERKESLKKINEHKKKYKKIIKELYIETVYKTLCYPNNINYIQENFEEEIPKPCENVDYISLERGSWKTDIRLVKEKDKVVVVYDRKSPKFYKFEWEEIQREMMIQNKVHEKTNLAPKIHFINYTHTNDLYTIMLIQDYAGEDKYKLIDGDETIKKLLCLKNVEIKIDKETSLSENFQNFLKFFNEVNFSINEKDIKPYSDFFFGGKLKENLNVWYNKCGNFFKCFFRELHKLHKINVFHHDLSGQNVWYKKEGKEYKFKFIDFGLSTTYEETYVETKEYKQFFESISKEKKSSFGHFMDFFQEEKVSKEYNKNLIPEIVTKDKETLKKMMLAELSVPECIHGFNMENMDKGIKEKISSFQLFNHIIGDDFLYFLLRSESILNEYNREYRIRVNDNIKKKYENEEEGKPKQAKINKETQNSMVSVPQMKEKRNVYRNFFAEKYADAFLKSS